MFYVRFKDAVQEQAVILRMAGVGFPELTMSHAGAKSERCSNICPGDSKSDFHL